MEDQKPYIRNIFNATTQQVEPATLSVDSNGEIVARFENGAFEKFPAGLTVAEFNDLVTKLETANKGQVSVEATEELVKQLAAEEPNPLPELAEQPAVETPVVEPTPPINEG